MYIVVQQIFLPRWMNKGSTTFGRGTRSRTSLTLGCPSVENGAATLTSKQASMRLIFQGGLRLPLNAFARELLVKLGLGVCQFNPNVWRLIISMQILRREVFGGDCPLIVDEFLFCSKPSEMHQSLGFYQFTTRGTDCRLIKSLASSNRNQKKEFFFVSSFWAGNLVDVGRDTFGRCTKDLENLRPQGKSLPLFSSFLSLLFKF